MEAPTEKGFGRVLCDGKYRVFVMVGGTPGAAVGNLYINKYSMIGTAWG